MMNNGQIKIEYDNRFGFAKYCTAIWLCDSVRVGEQFLFKFPNGINVSVIRHTGWRGYNIVDGSCAGTYGFAVGKYEVLVYERAEGMFRDGTKAEAGYLDHKEVHQLLSRWRNYRS